jgi:hypothetical protein
LLVDKPTARQLRKRQDGFIASSTEVTLAQVRGWPLSRRFMNNAVAMFGPLL